jgi:hypothetical protein
MRGLLCRVLIDHKAKLFAWFEKGNALGAHWDRLACSRITAGTSLPRAGREGPKAADLNPPAVGQLVSYRVEERCDELFDIACRQIGMFRCEPLDKI